MISNKIKESLSKRYERILRNYRDPYIHLIHTLYFKGRAYKFKAIPHNHFSKEDVKIKIRIGV